ncbi:hypothetical protein C8R44DRAFT_651023 [Mycena epipterygia]|nr:hypothetical protein C8R44DRAFT_651023 [Mycena epipterygia]
MSRQSGVGKSSLINYSFGVDKANVSHQGHGISDINTEITSPQNSLFVVHDSQGFEPGETTNFERVKDFLQSRGEIVPLKDRVHAVWLCIKVPFAGGRVFETGDEKFLKLVSNTGLGADFNSPDRPALRNLINITQDLVSHDVQGLVWVVSAMAQRASARAKIDASIEVGMKRYWQGLASSASFSNSTLETCLATIHVDITSSWNFNDPDDVRSSSFNYQHTYRSLSLVTQCAVLPGETQKSCATGGS